MRIFLTLVVFLLAAGWSFLCGIRGFFPFDQSHVFDGGLRLLHGQIPFLDFVFPHSFLLFPLQALAFSLFGVHLLSGVLLAALFNGIAAVTAFSIQKAFSPGALGLCFLTGAVTGIWLFPPIGTLYGEQTAFFFILAAILLALKDHHFLSGAAVLAAFFCKQNAALFFGPLPLLLMAFEHDRKDGYSLQSRLLRFGAGVAVPLLFIAVWLYFFSSTPLFVHYYIEIPLLLGIERLSLHPTVLALLVPTAVIGFILIMLLLHRTQALHRKPHLTASFVVAAYILCVTRALLLSVNNNPTLAYASYGLLFGSVGVVGSWLLQRAKLQGLLRTAASTLFIVAALGVAGWGMWRSYERLEQEGLRWAGDFVPIRSDAFQGFLWGEPTYSSLGPEGPVSSRDLVPLMELLKKEDTPIFFFPDYTFLSLVTKNPTSQPLLFFHQGLSYAEEDKDLLDRRIVSQLERDGTTMVILEQVSFLGTQNRLADFPSLRNWLKEEFVSHSQIGLFTVLKRKEPIP